MKGIRAKRPGSVKTLRLPRDFQVAVFREVPRWGVEHVLANPRTGRRYWRGYLRRKLRWVVRRVDVSSAPSGSPFVVWCRTHPGFVLRVRRMFGTARSFARWVVARFRAWLQLGFARLAAPIYRRRRLFAKWAFCLVASALLFQVCAPLLWYPLRWLLWLGPGTWVALLSLIYFLW